MIALGMSSAAHAIQPLETGLQPVYERLNVVQGAQGLLNEKLQAPDTALEQRIVAYRSWKILERERISLEASISLSEKWATSPLVTFISP